MIGQRGALEASRSHRRPGRARVAPIVFVVFAALGFAGVACKRGLDAVPDAGAPGLSPATGATEPATDPAGAPVGVGGPSELAPSPTRDLPGLEFAPDSMVIGQATTLVPGAPPPPPPPEDPFVAAIAGARVAGAACFGGQPPGDYAATIVAYVTPTGFVSRVEIEAGNVADPAVLACLRRVGEARPFPASPQGRTVRIDVHVRS